MNHKTRRTDISRRPVIWSAITLFILAVVATAVAYTGKPLSRSGAAAISTPQDVTRIESRLSQLEQRFYSIEVSLRGLEQQSRLSSSTTMRVERDPEIGLLRAEVESLRQRLAEAECGLARVDERTLNAAAKEARRKLAGGGSDPCRLNADAPLRLPGRP